MGGEGFKDHYVGVRVKPGPIGPPYIANRLGGKGVHWRTDRRNHRAYADATVPKAHREVDGGGERENLTVVPGLVPVRNRASAVRLARYSCGASPIPAE